MARRILIIAGLVLIGINLLGVLFPGLDIAMHGISSTQPLLDHGLSLRVLPLLAFILGVIAGSGLLAHIWWARGVIVAYAVILALAAPMWAQQVSLGFFLYTSKPPALLPVLLICLGAVALAIAAIVFVNRPAVKAVFSRPIPSERQPFPWALALAAVLIASVHFAMTMYVEQCLRTTPLQNGVPPPPLPPLAEMAFFYTHMLPSLFSGNATQTPFFIGQSMLFGLLLSFGAALILRTPFLRRSMVRWPLSRVLLWPLAGISSTIVLAILAGAFLFIKLIPTQQVHISSKDYASAQQRIEAIRKYSFVVPIKNVTDAAYDLRQYVLSIAPDGYVYRIALRGTPNEVAAWAKTLERIDGQWEYGDSNAFLANLGVNWQIESAPVNYRITNGYARVYEREGIILIAVMD